MRNWRRLSVIGVLTAGLILAFGSNPSMAAPRAHVYLLRGLLNIFSLGMDTLAGQLNKRGIYATVDNHADWQSLADSAAANYKAGKEGPIILIGHSLGADAVMEMAAYLGRRGVPVALVVPFDGTSAFPASANVARVLNLSQHYWMTRGPGFHGSLINVDLRGDPNIDHLNIDKSPRLHARVIAEVLAIVGSHRMEEPGKPVSASLKTGTVKPRKPEPGAAPDKSSERSGDGVATAVKPMAESGTPVIAAPERGGNAAKPAASKSAN
ncbi:MAG TPA: thioesterase domain-containing protein [Xanthobacteraceae bacterium]|nr:thioesterase domain-containing protein [Xanthobacteraceae bacterium]